MSIKKYENALDIGKADAMLKHSNADQFKQVLAGFLLKCIRLNLQQRPEPGALKEITEELYELLQATWPGAKPSQIWDTLKHGMGKQGQYRVVINYPTVANWILYQRQVKVKSETEKIIGPPIAETVEMTLRGLSEYRKLVASGEYKPRGRES